MKRAQAEHLVNDTDLKWASGHLERFQETLKFLRHAATTGSTALLRQELKTAQSQVRNARAMDMSLLVLWAFDNTDT